MKAAPRESRDTMPQDAELPGLEAMPEQDQEAIGTTLGALLTGFSQRNSDLLVDVYADDADWMNAFGTAKTGSSQIIEYLRGLFADANFDAGHPVAGSSYFSGVGPLHAAGLCGRVPAMGVRIRR